MFKPRTTKSVGQCGRAMHAPTGLIDITISSLGVGAKRLRSKLYAEQSEAARQPVHLGQSGTPVPTTEKDNTKLQEKTALKRYT